MSTIASQPVRLIAVTRILVPVDGSARSEKAVPLARAIAARTGATVVRFHAAEPGGASTLPQEAVDVQVASPWPPDAITTQSGVPGTAVCMCAHGRNRVAATLLGSTTEAVLRGLTEPVFLVGPRFDESRAEQALSSIVVALDGSPEAERIIPAATTWAARLSATLQLVAVIPAIGNPAEPSAVADYLQGLAADNPLQPQTFLLHGEPVSALCRHAGDAVLAMTTHGRSGIARAAFGSVMAGVVHRSTGAVLVAGRAYSPPAAR